MTTTAHPHLSPTPTEADVEQYRKIRTAQRDLHSKIVETVPAEALDEMGDLLGLRGEGGLFVFPFEDAANVLMDACLYAWPPEERSVVQEYAQRQAETGEPHLSSLERVVLDASTRARHCVFRIDEPVAEAGVRATHARTGEPFFLMDESLSRYPEIGGCWFTSRLFSLGPWEMTTGAALSLGEIPDSVMHSALQGLYSPQRDPEGTPGQAAIALTVLGLDVRARAEAARR